MNSCRTKVVFYSNEKGELNRVKELFEEVYKFESFPKYFSKKGIKWHNGITKKIYLDFISSIDNNGKEWFFNIIYSTPDRPLFSIILDLLASIKALKIDYVLESEGNNSSFLINTDKEAKFLRKKYYATIDTTKCIGNIDRTVSSFYSNSMENLYEKFQRTYKILTNIDFHIDSYEALIKIVEKLKSKNAFINIVMATSNYKPENDILYSKF